ncbi:hypothetical protein Droror1_Dr00015286 [Drosera rotundifolia]
MPNNYTTSSPHLTQSLKHSLQSQATKYHHLHLTKIDSRLFVKLTSNSEFDPRNPANLSVSANKSQANKHNNPQQQQPPPNSPISNSTQEIPSIQCESNSTSSSHEYLPRFE